MAYPGYQSLDNKMGDKNRGGSGTQGRDGKALNHVVDPLYEFTVVTTPFQLTASFGSFSTFLDTISHHGFGRFNTPSLVLLQIFMFLPRVNDFDFIVIMNLRIYKGFDRQSSSGCNFKHSVIAHSKIPYNFSNLLSS